MSAKLGHKRRVANEAQRRIRLALVAMNALASLCDGDSADREIIMMDAARLEAMAEGLEVIKE